MRTSPILDALFPQVRAELLAATFSRPAKEWYLSELAVFLHTRPSSLQRELKTLVQAGILRQRREGRRIYVQPDVASPVYCELESLLTKTAGIVPVLRVELKSCWGRVQLAFIYGSVARHQETSESDIDLMMIGSAGLADIASRDSPRGKEARSPDKPNYVYCSRIS